MPYPIILFHMIFTSIFFIVRYLDLKDGITSLIKNTNPDFYYRNQSVASFGGDKTISSLAILDKKKVNKELNDPKIIESISKFKENLKYQLISFAILILSIFIYTISTRLNITERLLDI